MDFSGFQHLIRVCEQFGLPTALNESVVSAPNTLSALGSHLDPELEALFSRTNGGQLWEIFLYGGVGTPNDLVGSNERMRRLGADPSELNDFVLFNQMDYQAAHLATVPALAGRNGLQPVVYLDLSEEMVVMPIASSVDQSFDLVARYLELVIDHYGSAGGTMELLFPWDVPELVAQDADLVALLASGRIDSFLGPSPSSIEWVTRVRRVAPS